MSERYSRLFALTENQYASRSPVVITAGALLKDNQTGKIIVQLKLRNINNKKIKAAKVNISPFDTVGNPLGDAVTYQYLDLSTERDEYFGQKVAVTLPEVNTRSFSVKVEEIVFADNSLWKATSEPWEVMQKTKSLQDIGDAELVKQFRMKYGADCKNLPLSVKDLWFCACGALNRNVEQVCHCCEKSYSFLSEIDIEELNSEKDARLVAERIQAAEEAAAANARIKRNVKKAAISIPLVAITIAATFFISSNAKKYKAYNDAIAFMNAGENENAIAIFSTLDGYKDSEEYLLQLEQNAQYNEAIQLLERGQHQKAYDIFKNLGDFKDSLNYFNGFQEKLIRVKFTTPNSKYYNYNLDITYNDAGETETKIKKYHQTGAKGYTEESRYQYKYNNAGYIVDIEYSYPETKKSKYSSNTIVGEKYVYDSEDRLIELQTIRHSGAVIHGYHILRNEKGEDISGGIGDVDLTYTDNCHICVVDNEGKKVKCWNEKYDVNGNLTGEIYKEIGYKYDTNGQMIEKIESDGTTYYTYEDGKLISEKTGETIITYEYDDSGNEIKSVRKDNGKVMSTLEYFYEMIYVPNENEK